MVKEVEITLKELEPFPHGSKKGETVKEYIQSGFVKKGWRSIGRADFKTNKEDYLDLIDRKPKIERARR